MATQRRFDRGYCDGTHAQEVHTNPCEQSTLVAHSEQTKPQQWDPSGSATQSPLSKHSSSITVTDVLVDVVVHVPAGQFRYPLYPFGLTHIA